MMRSVLIAAAAILASASCAVAQQAYNISITGSCDTLSLTVNSGIVIGVSNASNCDDGYMIGYQAKLKSNVGPGGKVLIAASDLSESPDSWSWAFNLKTGNATLTGTPDGQTLYQGNFQFTYTKDAAAPGKSRGGLPTAISATHPIAH